MKSLIIILMLMNDGSVTTVTQHFETPCPSQADLQQARDLLATREGVANLTVACTAVDSEVGSFTTFQPKGVDA